MNILDTLEASVGLALETYANVHRGTGYNSMASTLLYEQARNAILDVRGLDRRRYRVIFCTPARAAALEAAVRTGCHCAQILVKRLLRIHPMREFLADLGSRFAPRLTRSLLPGLVRVSFGLENEAADVRRLALALERIAGRRPSLVARFLARTHNAAPVRRDTETLGRMRAAMEREASAVYGSAPASVTEMRPRRQALTDGIPSWGMTCPGRPCCRKS